MSLLVIGAEKSLQNGATRSFYRLINSMTKQKNVHYILPSNINNLYQNTDARWTKKYLHPVRRDLRIVPKILKDLFFLHIFLKENKDINFIHINDVPWFYFIIISTLHKKKSSIYIRYVETNPLVRIIISFFLNRFSSVLFVSKSTQSAWPKVKKSSVISNPGKTELYQHSESKKYDLSRLKKFIIVSRISEEKGIMEAIRFFNSLQIKDSVLTIVGGANLYKQELYFEKIKQYIQDKNANVRLVGKKLDVLEYLLENDVFIHLPNFEDPFPNTILESLILNKIIITNFKGGIFEQVDKFEGVYSPNHFRNLSKSSKIIKVNRKDFYKHKFSEEVHIEKISRIFSEA